MVYSSAYMHEYWYSTESIYFTFAGILAQFSLNQSIIIIIVDTASYNIAFICH